ncbi:hypothetical protein EJB05_32311 [Eragrostis curvula]|uniref:Uncharacterized protein n=1 Tax=Eragrostis curvula TaxID=38414 RepID=A0A5J9UHG8_9POAL|nr:hypothetical protein EJB05_32311 [Eragrostis curvula]
MWMTWRTAAPAMATAAAAVVEAGRGSSAREATGACRGRQVEGARRAVRATELEPHRREARRQIREELPAAVVQPAGPADQPPRLLRRGGGASPGGAPRTATSGPSSPASSPAAPTTPSRTTGTSLWRASSGSSPARSAAASLRPRPRRRRRPPARRAAAAAALRPRRRPPPPPPLQLACRPRRSTPRMRRWPTRACSGGGAESDESASTCTTDLSLGSAGAAVPCFYQSYDMVPRATAPAPAAFAPSARSAFSVPSPARHREAASRDAGDKPALPFFDFLGVGAA